MDFVWDWRQSPYSFRILKGKLPAGMDLDGNTGTLSGTPTNREEVLILISVLDYRGRAYQWLRMIVN
jgi:hypothetical protein